MQHYIIDGNNLIGKIKELFALQKQDGQRAREKLAFMLDRYFSRKKVSVSLHFDGYPKDAIRTANLKIIYSENRPADILIKEEIDRHKNPKLITVISSDASVYQYAKVNACGRMKCEDFAKRVMENEDNVAEQEEDDIIKNMDNDEFKKLFGIE